MLFHIAFLSELLRAELAREGLDSDMHPHVVNDVISAHEFFSTVWDRTYVN